MAEVLDRQQARRVFEETIATVAKQYAPMEDFLCEARATEVDGTQVTVALYKIYTDGRWECFQVLDEVLWPSL